VVKKKSLQSFSLRHASFGAAGRPTSKHADTILSGGLETREEHPSGRRTSGAKPPDGSRAGSIDGSDDEKARGTTDGLVAVGGADEISDPRAAGYMSDASRGSSSEEEERIISRTRK